jgi:hypothetical protein
MTTGRVEKAKVEAEVNLVEVLTALGAFCSVGPVVVDPIFTRFEGGWGTS